MKTKTWKLGEICKGGIITVEIRGKKIIVIGKEWDYAKGSNKGSNQSNAKEWTRLEVQSESSNANRELSDFLHDLTHSWAVDEIMKYIESQVKLPSMFW